jgi:hypothetical protein
MFCHNKIIDYDNILGFVSIFDPISVLGVWLIVTARAK